jgi:membrane dipeptidase
VKEITMKEGKRIHGDSIVILCHEDVPIDITHRRMNGEKAVMARIHLPRYRQGGVNMAVMAVGGDQIRPFVRPQAGFPTYMEGALHSISQMYAEEQEASGGFFIIRYKSDLDRLHPDGPVGITLHLEGAKPLAGQLSMLDIYYRLGVRSMQLAWYGRNELADSTAEQNPGGLTRFGVEVVKAMNEMGMLIDLSHVAEPSFYDTIKVSRQPVVATHSNAKKLADNPRNLTDDQIKAIASTGGLVGAVFYPPFVRVDSPTLEHILDHVDYMRDLVGIEHIGIGPDFVDYAPELILGDVATKGLSVIAQFPKDAENVTKMPNVTKGLLARGYKEEEVKKILGVNFLRVLREVWKS